MAGEESDIDGFINIDGELIPITETDKVSAIILAMEDLKNAAGCLWRIAVECYDREYFSAACEYFEKVLSLDVLQLGNQTDGRFRIVLMKRGF